MIFLNFWQPPLAICGQKETFWWFPFFFELLLQIICVLNTRSFALNKVRSFFCLATFKLFASLLLVSRMETDNARNRLFTRRQSSAATSDNPALNNIKELFAPSAASLWQGFKRVHQREFMKAQTTPLLSDQVKNTGGHIIYKIVNSEPVILQQSQQKWGPFLMKKLDVS